MPFRKTFAALAGSLMLLSACLAGAAWAAGKAKLDPLAHPAAAAWPSDGRDYSAQRYSPLTQINAANVGKLGLAWYDDLDTFRGVEATPIYADGVLYNTLAWNVTTAYDARTGKKLWTYDPQVPREYGRYACCEPVARGLALSGNKIIIGTLDGRREMFSVKVPRVLSFLATGHFDGKVQGIDDVQAAEAAAYGPGDYRPVVPVTYWNFRAMVGIGLLTALIALLGLWLLRRRRLPENRWVWRIGVLSLALPFIANSTGWIFTEMGRQPWVVYGLMKTSAGVSPGVTATSMLISVLSLTVLYGILMVIEAGLMARYVKAGPPSEEEVLPPAGEDPTPERPLTFAY